MPFYRFLKGTPKRVYNLCYQLWQDSSTNHFTEKNVMAAWDTLIKLRQKDIRKKLSFLSNSQLSVLMLISTDLKLPISGKEAQRKTDLSSAAIVKALQFLEDEDFVTQNPDNTYSMVDPLIKGVLRIYEQYNLLGVCRASA